MALKATVRTLRVLIRLRRPCLPHFGQGAFLGAHRTGITIGVGASVPMACISGVEDVKYPHSPGCRPYLSRAKRLVTADLMVEISAKSRKSPESSRSASGGWVEEPSPFPFLPTDRADQWRDVHCCQGHR